MAVIVEGGAALRFGRLTMVEWADDSDVDRRRALLDGEDIAESREGRMMARNQQLDQPNLLALSQASVPRAGHRAPLGEKLKGGPGEPRAGPCRPCRRDLKERGIVAVKPFDAGAFSE